MCGRELSVGVTIYFSAAVFPVKSYKGLKADLVLFLLEDLKRYWYLRLGMRDKRMAKRQSS